jgi:hypothetical protein
LNRAAGGNGGVVFFLGTRKFGPLGMAYTGYRMWRRLSPQQKAMLRGHAGTLAGRVLAARRPPAGR